MGAGSGGFYAAREAFKQAAAAANNPRIPADNLGALIPLFVLAVMLAMLGTPGFLIAGMLLGIVLLGTAHGTVLTLASKFQRRMQVAIGASYALALSAVYLGTKTGLVSLGLESGDSHVLASGCGFIAGFAVFTLTRRVVWRHYDANRERTES